MAKMILRGSFPYQPSKRLHSKSTSALHGYVTKNRSNLRKRTELMKRDDLLLGSETASGDRDEKNKNELKNGTLRE